MPRPKKALRWFAKGKRETKTDSQLGPEREAPRMPVLGYAKALHDRVMLAALINPAHIPPVMPMSERQRIFADRLWFGYNASQAYRLGYGYKSATRKALDVRAVHVSRLPAVQARIGQLTERAAGAMQDEHKRRKALVLSGLEEIAQDRAHPQRVKSLELLGKVRGTDLFTDRVETVKGELTAEQVQAQLSERLERLGLSLDDVVKPKKAKPLALPSPAMIEGTCTESPGEPTPTEPQVSAIPKA